MICSGNSSGRDAVSGDLGSKKAGSIGGTKLVPSIHGFRLQIVPCWRRASPRVPFVLLDAIKDYMDVGVDCVE